MARVVRRCEQQRAQNRHASSLDLVCMSYRDVCVLVAAILVAAI
jgi:hypothetical protein